MMELLGLLLVLGLIATLILPWMNLARICSMHSELERLRWEVQGLRDREGWAKVEKSPAAKSKTAEPKVAASAHTDVPEKSASGSKTVPVAPMEAAAVDPRMPLYRETSRKSPRALAVSEPTVAEPGESVEPQDWFSKIAVWVGGIALLMAGFYMVKYSIDSGWLTPAVRLWLTTGFGALLCGAGCVIGVKSSMVANERIGQALSGAGIACLYFAAYAAVHLYGFLSAGQGFAAMFGVTVLAVALSLRNGAPIAMMGLVGGFLTPWLMSTGSQDTAMLFTYLFLLFCGAQFLCVRRGWWALLLGSLVGAYLWSAVVIVGNLGGMVDNLEGSLLFVLGICLVNAVWAFFARNNALDATGLRLLAGIRWLTWGGGLVQGFVLVLVGGFAAVDMALFGLLSVGSLVLAVLREDEFIWAAWLALSAVAAATLSNTELLVWSWLAAPLWLMGLFFAVGHWRGLSSERALVWRSLSVAAAVLTVPLLYSNREWIVVSAASPDGSLWLGLSMLWAGLLALAGEQIFRREGDVEVAGEYSAFAVFLALFGLCLYLPERHYAHASGGLLLAAALYWKWRGFGRAKLVLPVLAGAWALWMLPCAESAFGYFFQETMGGVVEQDGAAMVGWALGLVGLAATRWCFRGDWEAEAKRWLAWALGIVALLAFVSGYQWLDAQVMPAAWTVAAVGGGLTSLLALAAVGLAFGRSRWPSCQWASQIVAALVGLRIVWLHLAAPGAGGLRFFWNPLALQFGLPFLACGVLAWQSGTAGLERPRQVYQLATMLLGFIWATFLVQDYYGGSYLWGGTTSSGELYTYSVVWLLLAVAYQAIGLWRDQAAIHVGSLVLLLITIGKVFLVDASELEGLFRVLSFLGLGLALIGIGFFYNKVVFARRKQAQCGDLD